MYTDKDIIGFKAILPALQGGVKLKSTFFLSLQWKKVNIHKYMHLSILAG